MEENDFRDWLENKDIKDYTKNRYIKGINKVNEWLIAIGEAYPNIYEINNPIAIEAIKHLELFKERDIKAHRMYSAALNHYQNYLIEKKGIQNLIEDEQFLSAVNNKLANLNNEYITYDNQVLECTEKYKSENEKFKRNPQKTAEAIEIAFYKCEIDSKHISFISKVTNKNYCEGHHLIPIYQQINYSVSLDIHPNIVSLCPNCHRLLHHGIKEEITLLLFNLYELRRQKLAVCGIEVSFKELLNFYL